MTIPGEPLLRLQNVSMSFGATKALDNIDFACFESEIHAVLGENGAGKSTLMKLIAGVLQPSAGQLFLDGMPVQLSSPSDAGKLGLVCMFQELSLVPDLTVRENLLLASSGSNWGWLSGQSLPRARQILERIDAAHIAMGSRIADLSLPERQQVEIAKAIIRKPRLLILDEATSALNASVVDKVFDLIRTERDQGASILFISHRFHEVEALADRLSVFRNGKRVDTFDNGKHGYTSIINMMVGQQINELFPPRPEPPENATEFLRVDNFSWNDVISNVSLSVNAGSIVGLGGLDGQGQGAFLMSLFGLLRKTQGTITIEGKPVNITAPSTATQPDIALAFIPEDRKTEGLIQAQSILENLQLAAIGVVGQDAHKPALYETTLAQLELKHGGLELPVSSLSGGNQQKVVLAKWLALKPRCLLLADPTRGIDVKTKTQIYHMLRQLANAGTAIILLSTDYEELIQLCDEIHVFYGGRIAASLRGEKMTAQNVISASLSVPVSQAASDD